MVAPGQAGLKTFGNNSISMEMPLKHQTIKISRSDISVVKRKPYNNKYGEI